MRERAHLLVRSTALAVSLAVVGSTLAVGVQLVDSRPAAATTTFVTVPSNANIFGAGLGCGGSGQPNCPSPGGDCNPVDAYCTGRQGGVAPTEASIPTGTTYLTFASSNGAGDRVGQGIAFNGSTPNCSGIFAAGTSGSTEVSGVGGISGLVVPGATQVNVGVFLGSSQPANAPRTPYLDPYNLYSAVAPELGQLFVISNGTFRSEKRKYVIPDGAESVYFGWISTYTTTSGGMIAQAGAPGWYGAISDTWNTSACAGNPPMSGPISGTVSFETGSVNDPWTPPEVDSPSGPNAQCTGGDPCDTFSGMFTQSVTDVEIPGRSPGLALARTYRSTSASTMGPLGSGWSFTYGMALSASTPSSGFTTITEENGAQTVFRQTPSGAWIPNNPRSQANLAYNSGSSTWTFTRRNVEIFTFNASGKLTKVQSAESAEANGRGTTLTYPSGQIIATDRDGRTLTFTFDSVHADRIAMVTDPAGRSIEYTYDSSGDFLLATRGLTGELTEYCYNQPTATAGCPAHDSGQPDGLLTVMRDPRGGEVTNTYDTATPYPRVISQTDREGKVTEFEYGAAADPDCDQPYDTTTKLTMPDGSDGQPDIRLDSYFEGSAVCVTRKGSGTVPSTTEFTYDRATGERSSMIDPNSHTTTYRYDPYGRVTQTVDPLGRTTSTDYNSYGMPVTQVDATDVTTTFEYAPSYPWFNTKVSRPLIGTSDVQETETTYNLTTSSSGFGDMISSTDPMNNSTTYGRDTSNGDFGYVTSVTDPEGNVETATYDLIGRPTTSTTPNGNTGSSPDPAFTTVKTYDPAERARSVAQTPDGVIGDSFGRAPSVSTLGATSTGQTWNAISGTWGIQGASGHLVTGTNGQATINASASGTISFSLGEPRDGMGVVFHHSNSSNYWRLVANVTAGTWDLQNVVGGSVVESNSSAPGTCCDRGQTVSVVFDGSFLVATGTTDWVISATDTSHSTSTGIGLFAATATPGGTSGSAGVTSFTYTPFDPTTFTTDRFNLFSYDPNGNLSSTRNSAFQFDRYTYDGQDRETSHTSSAWAGLDPTTTQTTYFDNGLVESQIDNAGAATTYTYDHARRRTSMTDPAGRTTAYDYDPAGNQIRERTPLNPTACDPAVTRTYNDANELENLRYGTFTGGGCNTGYTPDADTPDVTYAYDDLGQRSFMTDGTGLSCYEFDSLRRLRTYLTAAGSSCASPDPGARTTTYGYDLANNQTTHKYPTQTNPITRTYDDAGRTTSITDWNGTTSWWKYDNNSNITCMAIAATDTCGAGGSSTIRTDYHYNVFDDLASDGATPAISAVGAPGSSAIFDYTRTRMGNVESEQIEIDGNTSAPTYNAAYDSRDRLTVGGGQSYSYDTAGNLTEFSSNTTLDYSNDPGQTCPPTCTGEANQPYQKLDITSAPIATYSYDDNGQRSSVTPAGSTTEPYDWDKAGRLLHAPYSPFLGYNGDGLWTDYTAWDYGKINWDVTNPIAKATSLEFAGVGVHVDYLIGPDGIPYAEIIDGTTISTRYLTHDQLGSIRTVLDATGTTIGTMDYDPFGNVDTHGDYSYFYGFAGETWTWQDNGSIVNLRARWYDPTSGQFLSRDPLASETLQPYSYAGNNPLNMTDPTGLYCPWWDSNADCDMQEVANLAAGTLNGMSFGMAQPLIDSRYDIDWDSPAAVGGSLVGGAAMMPFAVQNPTLYLTASRYGGAAAVVLTCTRASAGSEDCMAATASYAVSSVLPGMVQTELQHMGRVSGAYRDGTKAMYAWLYGSLVTPALQFCYP